MNEHINDIYVKKAKMHNYRSRAAFKLIEINQRYNILKPGYKVIDLGSSPGGWTQVAVEKVNSTIQKPLVLSIDKLPMTEVPGSHFLQGDMEDEIMRIKIKEFFELGTADVVLSDMAPNFCGDKDTDHMGISVLNSIAYKVCSHSLRPGGTLLMKTLHGALEGAFFIFITMMLRLGTGFKLSEGYLKFQKIQAKQKAGQKVDDKEFDEAGINNLELKQYFERIIKKSQELGLPIDTEAENIIKSLGIKYDPTINSQNKDSKYTFEEAADELLKASGLKLSFMKTLPKNLKELQEFSKEKDRKRAERIKLMKEGESNDVLFEEDEDEKNMQYEKMNALADIDDMPDDYFEDELREKQHIEESEKENWEKLAVLKQESKEIFTSMQDALNNPNKFDDYIQENPEELNEIMEAMKQQNSFDDLEDELDNSYSEDHNHAEYRKAKEELRVLKEKNKEFQHYFKQGSTYENLWKKK